MKKVLLGGFSLLILFGFGLFLFYTVNLQPVGGSEEKIFVINRGESTRSIARRLERQSLIKNQYVLLAYLRLTNQVGELQAGSFRLSAQNSIPELVRELQQGRIDVWVTFVEGQRREEYAELLNEKLNLPKEEFLDLTRGKEGQLFPDSYLLPNDVVVPQVVNKLIDNFESKWQTVDNSTELTKNQILIIASLVEREAQTDEDRMKVASILIKRWQNDWPLQVDAAVQYAKANETCNRQQVTCDWWPEVTSQDLKTVDSPYNIYMYKGLPPTPICNPSLISIKAVVNYQPTDYWYYLSDSEGKTYYARTIEEHNANIAEHLN